LARACDWQSQGQEFETPYLHFARLSSLFTTSDGGLFFYDNVITLNWWGNQISLSCGETLALGCRTTRGFCLCSFGAGIWLTAHDRRSLKVTAILIIGKEILGLTGTLFFPIHLRVVEGNYSDIMHGIVTAVGVFLFMFPAMIAGAVAFKGIFRIYSIVTMTLFIVFGIFTGTMQPQYVANLPTPMMGVWERINIYGYMLWIVILSIMLLRLRNKQSMTQCGETLAPGLLY